MKTTKAKTPKAPKQPQAHRNGKLDKTLTIAKIRELYHGESLAVHLTKVDRYNNPIAGFIVAHSTSDDELMQKAQEYHLENPNAQLYTFRAGSYFPEGVAVVLNIFE